MSFRLIFGDHDLVLPLALDDVAELRLMEIMGQSDAAARQRAEFARKITDVICEMLDSRLTPPPSDKQVKYAVSIARALGLPIPPEALQYRDAMTVFLTTHAPTYRQRRRGAG